MSGVKIKYTAKKISAYDETDFERRFLEYQSKKMFPLHRRDDVWVFEEFITNGAKYNAVEDTAVIPTYFL